jgi:3-oxoacyl-[acyl-carrier-protein] synthase-3
MNPVYITGLGVFMPNNPVSSDDVERVLGSVNNRPSPVKDLILERNGIKFRYYAIDPETGKQTHNNAQLTAEAVRELSRNAGFPLENIESLVCGTSSPDQMIPNHACMVHGELGNPPCEVVSTAGVCCSGMTAFKYGYMNVASGLTKNAVVTGSELASAHLRATHFKPEIEAKYRALQKDPYLAFENEFLRWMLSDGAGAVLITDSPHENNLSLKIDWIEIISFANQLEPCMYWGATKKENGSFVTWGQQDETLETLVQDGYFNLAQDVRLLAENIIDVGFQKSFEMVKARHPGEPDDIDWLLPHYSSEFFRQPIYDKLVQSGFVIPFEKWFTNLSYKGNTGSASIFIILEELMASGRVKQGDVILCAVPESARFSFAYMQLTAV